MDDEQPEDRDTRPWVPQERGRIINAWAYERLLKKYGRPDGTIDGRPTDAKVDRR